MMALYITGNLGLDKNMGTVNKLIKMVPVMRVNGLAICLKDKVFLSGVTIKNIWVHGRITLCTERDSSPPMTEENILVFT